MLSSVETIVDVVVSVTHEVVVVVEVTVVVVVL